MSRIDRSEAEKWNRYWREGYGGVVVKTAEKVCSKRACNTILNYLYECEFPNPIQTREELVELRAQLNALLHTLK